MRREPTPEERRSPLAWRFMAAYFARYLARHLNALRVARWGRPAVEARTRYVVYSNHPSWWDAALYVILARRLFPDHASFAPFEAAQLARYRVLARIGAFPVEADTRKGGAGFLRAARSILSRDGRALWITAQGRFGDVRERPLGLKPGIARLPELAPDVVVLPLALDYAFWSERGAEACCAFGAPLRGGDLLRLERPARLARLEAALTDTLDRLSADVRARDPGRFTTLIEGRRGVGGIYDAGRRLAARVTGRRFDPAHDTRLAP